MIGIALNIDPTYWRNRWFVVPSITALAIALTLYGGPAIQES